MYQLLNLGISEEVVRNSGSVNCASGARETKNIQKAFEIDLLVRNSSIIDGLIVHEFKTIFPIPLAIGCSWDLELAEKSAEIACRFGKYLFPRDPCDVRSDG